MPCQISDYLYYYSSALTPVALANQTIVAVPGADFYRLDVGGDYRLLGVNPNIPSSALKFGIAATTDAAGLWSITLPYGAGETHPASPEPQWSIVFPDGRVASGVVPSAAGPVSIDDLLTSYGWTLNSAVYVAPATQGALARGTAVFSAATTATILLDPPMLTSAYGIRLAASVDSVTGEVPVVGWSAKTTTGFQINTSGSFSGSVDWEAVL